MSLDAVSYHHYLVIITADSITQLHSSDTISAVTLEAIPYPQLSSVNRPNTVKNERSHHHRRAFSNLLSMLFVSVVKNESNYNK